MKVKDWRLEYERVHQQNLSLTKEIRHLRCVMVEAASSINPAEEPILFKQLTGERGFLIDDRCNPYPEHDEHVTSQYMSELTAITESLGGYNAEPYTLPSLSQAPGAWDGEI